MSLIGRSHRAPAIEPGVAGANAQPVRCKDVAHVDRLGTDAAELCDSEGAGGTTDAGTSKSGQSGAVDGGFWREKFAETQTNYAEIVTQETFLAFGLTTSSRLIVVTRNVSESIQPPDTRTR